MTLYAVTLMGHKIGNVGDVHNLMEHDVLHSAKQTVGSGRDRDSRNSPGNSHILISWLSCFAIDKELPNRRLRTHVCMR